MYYRNKPKHDGEEYHHMVKENFTAGDECKFPLWLLIVIVILILIAGGLLIYQLMHKKTNTTKASGSYNPYGQGYTQYVAQGYPQQQRFGYGFL